jgi:predicted nicotinamide N-methyase
MEENSQEAFKKIIYDCSSIVIKDSCDFEISLCGIGGRIWKSAVLLSTFLRSENLKKYINFENKIILEIGAGSGVCGLVSATLNPKKVYLSDRDKGCLEVLQKNVDLNKANIQNLSDIEVIDFDWSNMEDYAKIKENIDIVIGSDVLYCSSMIECLINTVRKFCNNNTLIIFALPQRGDLCDLFLESLNKTCEWKIELVPDDLLVQKFYKHAIIFINKI